MDVSIFTKNYSMQKVLTTLLFCCVFACCFAQKQRMVSTYLTTQFNTTLYDITKADNPWAVGLGLQAFLNIAPKFKPSIELTGDAYLMNTKILRLDSNGNIIDGLEGMVNLFAGASYNPTKRIYFSLLAGPSLVSRETRLGIKPSIGFYFPRSQRWVAKVSYINIFDRNKATKKDFGSLSFAVGFKLF
jgi:hypothetical protein